MIISLHPVWRVGPLIMQYGEFYYHEHTVSPMATDGVLFQFDKEDFQGGQGFQVPTEGIYNA